MKLEPRAKAVRIRINSNGFDNSSVEELRNNFDLKDVLDLMSDGRLLRWLRQHNETVLSEYVESIDTSETDLIKCKKLIHIFFPNSPEVTEEIDNNDKFISFCFRNEQIHINGYRIMEKIADSGDANIIGNVINNFQKELNDLSEELCELRRKLCQTYVDSIATVSEDDIRNLMGRLNRNAINLRKDLLWSAPTVICRTDISYIVEFAVKDVREKRFDFHRYIDICKEIDNSLLKDAVHFIYELNRMIDSPFFIIMQNMGGWFHNDSINKLAYLSKYIMHHRSVATHSWDSATLREIKSRFPNNQLLEAIINSKLSNREVCLKFILDELLNIVRNNG